MILTVMYHISPNIRIIFTNNTTIKEYVQDHNHIFDDYSCRRWQQVLVKYKRVIFPNSLHTSMRTMLTSETQVGRTSHVITDLQTGRLRVRCR